MKVTVQSLKSKKVKEIDLPEAIFAYPYKEHLIHLVVQANQAAERRGTHKTKDRSEVRGSGRKAWRQKGTGRARTGSTRSPLWRTGGTTFGPQPRDYRMRVSSNEKRSALKSALSRKLIDGGVLVVDKLELASHKTKDLAEVLAGLGVAGRALLVDHWENDNLGLAARNNPRLKAVDALALTVYDVVDRPHLVISESALQRVAEVLAK